MNPIRNQNYIALDLELNNKNDGSVPKIIEVGIAVGSPFEPQNVFTCNWYLDPEEPITPFITKLTGIDDETIRTTSVSHEFVAKVIGKLIDEYKCFSNPITWGQGDADELKAEFKDRNIEFPYFGRRIFDVKTIYVMNQMAMGKTTSGGLRSAMGCYGLKFKGQQHRAADDARNTLMLFFHLMKRQRMFEEYRETMRKMK